MAIKAPAQSGGGWSGPSSGLTHRWPMDNANVSGTTITDVVGSLNGTASAGITSATGPSGAANAARNWPTNSSQKIDLASCPVTTTSAFTIGLWLNLPDITLSFDGGSPRFFNFYDGGSNFAQGANRISTPGKVNLEYDPVGGNEIFTSSAALANNTWTHIAFVYNGSTYAIYVNASSVATTTDNGGADQATGNQIGNRASASCMSGSMAQLVIYNRALSGSEITTLYNAF